MPRTAVGYNTSQFFEAAEIRDVLDSVTVIYQALDGRGLAMADRWNQFVTRVLKEENIGYRLDSKCGVHYFVDEEFERNRFSSLQSLDDPKYSGVRDAYEAAYRHMDSDPPDTKATVRSMFESLEILVRQMVQGKEFKQVDSREYTKDKNV